jgi:hypothetical protein
MNETKRIDCRYDEAMGLLCISKEYLFFAGQSRSRLQTLDQKTSVVFFEMHFP